MTLHSFGSVVAMEFKARPDISFADFVEDFNLAFQMVDSQTRSLTWAGEHVAIVDRDYVRVALGWLPSKGAGQPWHLVMAIGCSPEEDINKVEPSSYEFLADRILDRTNEFLPATAVLRGDASQPVTPNLVNMLFELLRTDAVEATVAEASPETDSTDAENTFDEVIRDDEEEQYADMVETMLPPWAHGVEDEQVFSKAAFDKAEAELIEQNAAFQMGQSECSDPMRLTIHTLALSICLYVPPLGAAMFTYTMMRDIFPVAANAI